MKFAAVACAISLVGRVGSGGDAPPRLSAATRASLASCTQLATTFRFANTTITSAEPVPSGTLTWGGRRHRRALPGQGRDVSADEPAGPARATRSASRCGCRARGTAASSTRPTAGWMDAFDHALGGGGPCRRTALQQGFAVISSDAGHSGGDDPSFGIDFQARLDYGYQAAAKLTPMAKALIASAYGKPPDRSYFGGCSNGGRHTFVAMTRMPEEYDGYLAGAPGYRLPLAAIANQFGAKRYATDRDRLVGSQHRLHAPANAPAVSASRCLGRCDALDGAHDGIIQDTTACQAAFDFDRDVPTCSGKRDGTCLSAAQKTAIAPIFSGAVDGDGDDVLRELPVRQRPRQRATRRSGSSWCRSDRFGGHGDRSGACRRRPRRPSTAPPTRCRPPIDRMLAAVRGDEQHLHRVRPLLHAARAARRTCRLRDRGAKVIVYHGVSDAIFSVNDTTTWYEGLRADNGGDASSFARFFRVPGMAHCGGRAVDRPVRHADRPRRVGGTGRGAGPRRRLRPRRRERRRRQSGRAVQLVTRPQPPAVPLPEGGALEERAPPTSSRRRASAAADGRETGAACEPRLSTET